MREINKRQVGFRIKFVRELLNLTQLQFGELLGVSVGAVNNWEMGRNLPSKKNLMIIAKLGVKDVDYMLYGTQSKFTDEQLEALKEIRSIYNDEFEEGNPDSIGYSVVSCLEYSEIEGLDDYMFAEVVREFLNGVLGEGE